MGGLAPSEPFAPFPEPSLFATTSVGEASVQQMPLNPFDLPFDADSDSPDMVCYSFLHIVANRIQKWQTSQTTESCFLAPQKSYWQL
jgi:hypothetical protein